MLYTLITQTKRFVLISKHEGVDFHKGSNPVGLVETIRNDLHLSELYPLHRLDTMTSGLILFAKDRESARTLACRFREHTVEKFYLAVSDKEPKKKQGLVKGDMVRGRRGVWILSHTVKNPAITQFFSVGMGNGLRLYLLRPHTGRTHQVRVALKSIGAPILGDPLYHRKLKEGIVEDRGYLHACALSFTLDGKENRFVHLPERGLYFTNDNFKSAIKKFEDPWALPWPGKKNYAAEFRIN